MDALAGNVSVATGSAPRDSAVGRRIAQQIDANIDGHKPSGDAFVVSVYGEWGIGKTYCLQSVRDIFQDRLDGAIAAIADGAAKQSLVIPVFFDPWRFEHEEHLVVSLLKVIEHDLRRTVIAVEKAEKAAHSTLQKASQAGGEALALLGKAARVFADVAVALAASFKFKLAPLKDLIGAEVEFDLSKGLDRLDKQAEKQAAEAAANGEPDPIGKIRPSAAGISAAAKRESLYFDTQAALSALTEDGAGSGTRLRLVVLIDDLDRCLPEKAVQILESIKLFLNVPGFSFVLAVDDEVVERGIAYRYRDYLTGRDSERVGSPPISGAEYLEKIVHLPVHLHRWTEDEAKDYLRREYQVLFGPPARPEAGLRAQPGETDAKGARPVVPTAEAAEVDAVLAMVVQAVPLVPRKLIRLAEGIAFQRAHFVALGEAGNLKLAHLVRIVAIQQLYPALYRFLRGHDSRYWRLFETSTDEFNDPVYQESSVTALKTVLDSRRRGEVDTTDGAQARSGTGTIKEQYDLLALVAQACEQRGTPNPLRLFRQRDGEKLPSDTKADEISTGFSYGDFHRLYVHGLRPIREPVVARTASDLNVPVAEIQSAAAFLGIILEPDQISRGSALQGSGAVGKRLPDQVFEEMLTRLADDRNKPLLTDLHWLKDIATITSGPQLVTLYNRLRVLDGFLAAASA